MSDEIQLIVLPTETLQSHPKVGHPEHADDVKYMFCMSPNAGIHIFSIVNILSLVLVNMFLYDSFLVLLVVLANSLVFLPVIAGYVCALIKGLNTRDGRKTFFYACGVNNIGFFGILITVIVFLATSGFYVNMQTGPEWAQVFLAKPTLQIKDFDHNARYQLKLDEVEPMLLDVAEEGAADIAYDSDSEAKMATVDSDYYGGSYYYMPQWVQAIIGVLVLAVVLLFQIHSINVMFKYFTLTPM